MKLLFVIESFYPIKDATAKVLDNLLSSNEFKKDEIHLICYGGRDTKYCNIDIHSVLPSESFFFKVRNKLFKNRFIANSKMINSFSEKINFVIKQYNIEKVIFVMGSFQLLRCKIESNISVNAIYYDAFFNNFFYRNSKRESLIKIEKKFLDKCDSVFMLKEYIPIYKEAYPDSKKFIPFYVTAFYDAENKRAKSTNKIVHVGAFFEGLREPHKFISFCNECFKEQKNYEFISLGVLPNSLKDLSLPNNLKFIDRIFGDEYTKLISESKCFVLVDNDSKCVQIPSKTIEYVGMNKKIIFFPSSNSSNTSKLLENNRNVFIVPGQVDSGVIKKFDEFLSAPIYDERKKYKQFEKDNVAHVLKTCLEIK